MEIKTITNLSEITTEQGYELAQADTIYDLQGLSVTDIHIKENGITLKNAQVSGTLYIDEGAYDCRFENLRLISNVQPVVFSTGTYRTLFEKCLFRNTGEKAGSFIMNAGAETDTVKVNDKVILTDCYFDSYDCVIKVTRRVDCIINNGWCNLMSKIVYSDGLWGEDTTANKAVYANVVINGLDFEILDSVFSSAKPEGSVGKTYTIGNIIINGLLGGITSGENSGVVDYQLGYINLECNTPVMSTFKAFSSKSPKTHYCNIKKYGDMDYRITPNINTYTFTFTLAPDEVICPFGNMHFVRAGWKVGDTVDSTVRAKFHIPTTTEVTVGTESKTVYNTTTFDVPNIETTSGDIQAVGKLELINTSNTTKTVTITIHTYNILCRN